MMHRGGLGCLWENYPQGHSVCVCAYGVCLGGVGVSANLKCMHIFENDHVFICVKPEEPCACSLKCRAHNITLEGHAAVVFTGAECGVYSQSGGCWTRPGCVCPCGVFPSLLANLWESVVVLRGSVFVCSRSSAPLLLCWVDLVSENVAGAKLAQSVTDNRLDLSA